MRRQNFNVLFRGHTFLPERKRVFHGDYIKDDSCPFSVNRAGELITKSSLARLGRENEPRGIWGEAGGISPLPQRPLGLHYFRSLADRSIADSAFARPFGYPERDC